MKKLLLIIVTLCLSLTSYAQTYKFYQTQNIHNQLRLNTKTGEVYQMQDDGQRFLVKYAETTDNNNANRYVLFETKNMWTFILLDRYTGKLWQCQYSVEGPEYQFSIPINKQILSYENKPVFTIEPLVSMFQYYLINEENGEMWKFQWTTKDDDDYRWIEKIY